MASIGTTSSGNYGPFLTRAVILGSVMGKRRRDSINSFQEDDGGGSPPRRRLSAQQRREEILDAAADLYVSGQPTDFTVDDVIGKAGVSRATFYRIFRGLEDLRACIIGRIATAFQTRMFSGFGFDNQWLELIAGIREFLRIADMFRSDVILLLDNQGQGSIAEGMRDAVTAEISRRIYPIEETPLGRRALRAWIAAAEYEVRDWLQQRANDKKTTESADLITKRLAGLLEAVVCEYEATSDDVFITELKRVLQSDRRMAQAG